jgi:UDP-N-acetyl-D-galactosamine dehydrogenase
MRSSHQALLDGLLARDIPLAVVGLGYVGLPLALCLAKRFRVIGFDINQAKIAVLRGGRDPIGESGDAAIAESGISFADDPAALAAARLHIVCVPTAIDQAKRPDFTPLVSASTLIGRQLARGAVVCYESTVYPGATEEVCVPVLERESGLSAMDGFSYGYSPERINPGDREHTIERIRKVVAGCDADTATLLAQVYGAAIGAGVYLAPSVRVAEAAKVIENTQRDLNIALMNELALIFHRLDIDTLDVLAAAGTKWNFLPFHPGLVGGHCIGVDPYYLTHKAESVGYIPQVILAGRRINDGMGQWIAQECVRLMIQQGRPVKGATVLILGLAFKENCADVRNSRVIDIITELRRFAAVPVVVDPVADADAARREYGIELRPQAGPGTCAAVIAAVAHREFQQLDLALLAQGAGPGAPFLDIKGQFPRAELVRHGFTVWRL